MRLATELRRLRDAAGITGREAAASLGVSSAQISQIEKALAGVSEKRLRAMAANYACSDSQLIDALVTMASDRTHGWWEEYQERLPTRCRDLARRECHARQRSDVFCRHSPGLL